MQEAAKLVESVDGRVPIKGVTLRLLLQVVASPGAVPHDVRHEDAAIGSRDPGGLPKHGNGVRDEAKRRYQQHAPERAVLERKRLANPLNAGHTPRRGDL